MNRDIEYQLNLLKKMEEADDSVYIAVAAYGMDEEQQKEINHLQLLVDEGLVAKVGDHMYRLTAMGHNALDLHRKGLIKRAIEKTGDVAWPVLIETATKLLPIVING